MNGRQVTIALIALALAIVFLVMGLADVGCEVRYRVAPAEGICARGTDLRTLWFVLFGVVAVLGLILTFSPWGRGRKQ
jgi:hypothetical protein